MTMPSSVCDRLGVDGCDVPRDGYGELRRLRRVVRSAPGVPGVPPGLSSGISMAAGLEAGLETGDTVIECWLAGSLQPLPSASGETTIAAFISVPTNKGCWCLSDQKRARLRAPRQQRARIIVLAWLHRCPGAAF